MGIPQSSIISLNRSRQRAIYWRPDGRGGYMQTTPLPADAASINYYFLKGFKAKSPNEVEKPANEIKPENIKTRFTISCPICGFETQSAFGLQAHLRKHITKSKKKEESDVISN